MFKNKKIVAMFLLAAMAAMPVMNAFAVEIEIEDDGVVVESVEVTAGEGLSVIYPEDQIGGSAQLAAVHAAEKAYKAAAKNVGEKKEAAIAAKAAYNEARVAVAAAEKHLKATITTLEAAKVTGDVENIKDAELNYSTAKAAFDKYVANLNAKEKAAKAAVIEWKAAAKAYAAAVDAYNSAVREYNRFASQDKNLPFLTIDRSILPEGFAAAPVVLPNTGATL